MLKILSKFILFTLMGWSLKGQVPRSIKKTVIIIGPHTSWHDFYLSILMRSVIGLKINFIGKKALFGPLTGWYFRWLGGAPVDRSSKQNVVKEITALFKENEEFRLALSPEGTRKKVSEWRTGFYYIAHEAQVPIISISLDFPSKTIRINKPFYTTGDIKKDLPKIKLFYKGVVGKIPEYT